MLNPYDFYITSEELKIAEKNGISGERVVQRIRVWGWSKHKAITTQPQVQIDHGDWLNIAKANGICKSTFYGRINKSGWSVEKAATTPIAKPTGRSFKYSKDVHRKLKENNISRPVFYTRIKRGWTIERACTEKPLTPEEIIRHLSQWDKEHNNHFRQLNAGCWEIACAKHTNRQNRKSVSL